MKMAFDFFFNFSIHTFVVRNSQSLIPQILEVVGLLGKKLIFFQSVGI